VDAAEPPRGCPICPRLVAYRAENRTAHPDWFNGPAPSFGDPGARLLVVGLAPGRSGANRTGRPFTGDHAGVLLYGTLIKTGFASGVYEARPDDGLTLVDCMITNAVRCAPPGNKPLPAEEAACRPFLAARIRTLPRLKVIVTLGDVARRSLMRALGRGERPRSGDGGGGLSDHQQLSLLAAQHEHRAADRADVRGGVPARARAGGWDQDLTTKHTKVTKSEHERRQLMLEHRRYGRARARQ
jgi:uracil-DNA glycosylase family 4